MKTAARHVGFDGCDICIEQKRGNQKHFRCWGASYRCCEILKADMSRDNKRTFRKKRPALLPQRKHLKVLFEKVRGQGSQENCPPSFFRGKIKSKKELAQSHGNV